MAGIENLPVELVNIVCTDITRTDVLALRDSTRQMRYNTADALIRSIDSISVTCSVDGLDRLEKLVSNPHEEQREAVLKRIRDVTIHTVTVENLKEMASTYSPRGRYQRAYAHLRQTLLRCLNQMPNLEVIALTNEPFKDTLIDDEYPSYSEYPKIDPLREKLDRPSRTWGYESVLSILPELPPNIKLNLTVNYSHTNHLYGHAFVYGRINHTLSRYNYSTAGLIQQQLFGVDDFITTPILKSRLNCVVQKRSRICSDTDGVPDLLRATYQSTLSALTLDNLNIISIRELGNQSAVYSELKHLTISGTFLSTTLADFIQRHATTLRTITVTKCRGSRSEWEPIVAALADLPSLDKVKVWDCTCFCTLGGRFEFQFEYEGLSDDVEIEGRGNLETGKRFKLLFE